MYITPPPGTTPSSIAARVALNASSTRSFFSFISTSEAAPTLSCATPPASLARRSCSFSLSYVLLVATICALICATRFAIASLLPAPLTMVVLSLVTVMVSAVPNISMVACSNLIPFSSLITVPPVRIAMSSNISLRRSPKPGAFTAHIFSCARRRLTTSAVNASLSTSSAIISNGRPLCTAGSNTGRSSLRFEIFLS